MELLRKSLGIVLAAVIAFTTFAGPVAAAEKRQSLGITWAFLFPVPIPLPVWTVEHPDTFVTFGFLFPIWLPLPVYRYDDKGPIDPDFSGLEDVELTAETEVYVDGELAGTLESLAGEDPLKGLPDGEHTLELKDGGETLYAASFGVKDGGIDRQEETAAD